MADSPFSELERKVDALVSLCAELSRENSGLRAEQRRLRQRGELARGKVEAIISRLKAMEQDS